MTHFILSISSSAHTLDMPLHLSPSRTKSRDKIATLLFKKVKEKLLVQKADQTIVHFPSRGSRQKRVAISRTRNRTSATIGAHTCGRHACMGYGEKNTTTRSSSILPYVHDDALLDLPWSDRAKACTTRPIPIRVSCARPSRAINAPGPARHVMASTVHAPLLLLPMPPREGRTILCLYVYRVRTRPRSRYVRALCACRLS